MKNRLIVCFFSLLFFNNIVFSQTRKNIQNYTTVAALQAESLVPRVNDKVYISALKGVFTWESANVSAENGTTIIKQANVTTGRWVSVGGSSTPPTIQQLNATGNITAWNSVVEIGATPLTANTIITIPTVVENTGKTITFKRLDNTAFTVSIIANGAEVLQLNGNGSELSSQYGALTIQAVSATKSEQVSNIGIGAVAYTPVATVYPAANVTPTSGQATSATAAQFMSINIPSAGDWRIEWSVLGQVWQGNGGGTADGIASGLYDISGNFIANTELASASIAAAGSTTGSNIYIQGTRSFTVTTAGATTFNVKVWNPNGLTRATAGSGILGRSYVSATQLSGFLPVSPTAQPLTWGQNYWAVQNTMTGGSIFVYTFTGSSTRQTIAPIAARIPMIGSGAGAGVFTGSGVTRDITNNQLVITQSGRYNVKFDIVGGGSIETGIQLIKNGTVILNNSASFPNYQGANGSWEGELAVNETLELRAWVQTSGNYHFDGGTFIVSQQPTSISPVIEGYSAVPLTSGRVLALLDLASTTHINTDPGTKIPFTGTVYTNGMTVNAGSIIPSVSGKYRADWLCMAASTDFLADGIFFVVQNGVSVGQVSYNMNEASAVNQSAGFIDVDLVAGQEVSLHYRTRYTTTDGISWDRGSYFQLTQLPTAVAVVVNTVAEYGENNSITNGQTTASGTFTDVVGGSFTLPSAGVWEVQYNLISSGSSAASRCRYQIVRASDGSVVANSSAGFVYPAANYIEHVGQKSFITTTGADTYKLQFLSAGGTLTLLNANDGNGGNSKITWTKIAGQLPSTGQSVDYGTYTISQTAFNVPQDAITVTTNSGNIPQSAGVFTLIAGKTYKLSTNLSMTNYGGSSATNPPIVNFAWVDAISNTAMPSAISGTTLAVSGGATNQIGGYSNRNAELTITPSVDTNVKIRFVSGTLNGATSFSVVGNVNITQLGSSNAATTNAMAYVRADNQSGQSIPNISQTDLNGYTTLTDATGAFNAATGVFTAPRTSDYIVSFQNEAASNAWTVGQEWGTYIRVNGTNVQAQRNYATASGTYIRTGSVNGILRLNAGDTMRVTMFQSRGAATAINVASFANILSIRELPTAF